jgi:hypothetical protein
LLHHHRHERIIENLDGIPIPHSFIPDTKPARKTLTDFPLPTEATQPAMMIIVRSHKIEINR